MFQITLPESITDLLALHIEEEEGIDVTPEDLAIRVIEGAAKEGNLAEDYA